MLIRILTAFVAASVIASSAGPVYAQGSFVNWESPPVHPTVMDLMTHEFKKGTEG